MEEVQRVVSPTLNFEGALLKLEGKVYGNCIRSYMMHGSETWPMKKGHESMLDRAEMQMVR